MHLAYSMFYQKVVQMNTFHMAIITMPSHGACNQFYHSQFCICNASLEAPWLFTWHYTLKRSNMSWILAIRLGSYSMFLLLGFMMALLLFVSFYLPTWWSCQALVWWRACSGSDISAGIFHCHVTELVSLRNCSLVYCMPVRLNLGQRHTLFEH